MLDERLVTALTKEDIRLLRVEWLLAQREDFKIPRRQELEELERADRGLSPFLTGEEAAALIRNGAREVGALSYGWLLPWDPDLPYTDCANTVFIPYSTINIPYSVWYI